MYLLTKCYTIHEIDFSFLGKWNTWKSSFLNCNFVSCDILFAIFFFWIVLRNFWISVRCEQLVKLRSHNLITWVSSQFSQTFSIRMVFFFSFSFILTSLILIEFATFVNRFYLLQSLNCIMLTNVELFRQSKRNWKASNVSHKINFNRNLIHTQPESKTIFKKKKKNVRVRYVSMATECLKWLSYNEETSRHRLQNSFYFFSFILNGMKRRTEKK